uniref:Aminotransferase class I/II-fold pyridoxal phosphate-dependent enzyme n=1 Tax=Roseihalotalea indica TaxID=2867963 RepID=A0AA49GTA4_9BACT|nr:aminotransferase class I/II-fold pyridoxal phosphate-dependent enzyme [Tunicatimonas sp. TK19036]
MKTNSLPGRTIIVDGNERLYFSGTSYLGISKNIVFQELLREGFGQYGTGYSSSRSSNVQLAVYEEAENWLCDFTGAASALTFSSGYLAGQALIRSLDHGQRFLYAPQTHPALWRNEKDSISGMFKAWIPHLESKVGYETGEVVIVANSVDPLYANPHSFDWVAHLPDHLQITLVIDDSHGLGVLGELGNGVYASVRQRIPANVSLIVVSSLGKALGVPGGVVLGDSALTQRLRKSPFFTGASPIAPAYLYAMTQSGKVYTSLQDQLRQNVHYFQSLIQETSLFQYFGAYPVFYTPNNDLCKVVEKQCILSSFPYPDPDSEPITRVVVNALHTKEDLDTLGQLVQEYAVVQS